MLSEALAALASTGGTALVTAMVTDGWEDIKTRFVRLMGRGSPIDSTAIEGRLDVSRARLEGLTGKEFNQARAEQEIAWTTRLSDLLEQEPDVEAEMRDLIAHAQSYTLEAGIKQHAAAFDQARQAVLGQGIQNVTFGDSREPGTT